MRAYVQQPVITAQDGLAGKPNDAAYDGEGSSHDRYFGSRACVRVAYVHRSSFPGHGAEQKGGPTDRPLHYSLPGPAGS